MIEEQSVWQHKNGNYYQVIMLTNLSAEESRKTEYPPTVVYKSLSDGKVWSRTVERWFPSFTLQPHIKLLHVKCPFCDKFSNKRYGVHFEHERICGSCGVVWEPGNFYSIDAVNNSLELLNF